MNQQDRFHGVLASLREAAFDDARWGAASVVIDELCGLKGNKLVLCSWYPEQEAHVLLARFFQRGQRRQDWERKYYRVYHAGDERVARIRALPDGRVVPMRSLYTPKELRTSPAYNEILAATESQRGLIVRLDGPNGTHIVWGTAEPIAAAGWENEHLGTLERLLPHLRHYVRVRQALADAKGLGGTVFDLLDNTRIGALFLDRQGRILQANDRARGILMQGNGLRDENGFLRADLPADNARFEQLLSRALPVLAGEAQGGSTTVRRSPASPRLVLHISPVTARQKDFGASRLGALVLIRDPGNTPRHDERLVAASLGLTRAEGQVAVALAGGRSIGDIASSRGTKEVTVRAQIKSILRKQGIPRQTDLVRLLLTTPGFARSRW